MKYIFVTSTIELEKLLSQQGDLHYFVFQDLDFSTFPSVRKQFHNCLFLGCNIPHVLHHYFKNCIVFPALKYPFNPYRAQLYSNRELYQGYELGKLGSYKQTLDYKIFKHFKKYIEAPNRVTFAQTEEADYLEILARRLHDNSISQAIAEFIKKYDEKKVVAIMGGHQLKRNTIEYKNIVYLSKQLTEQNYLMVSGGGPGAMEATHLGAWMAGCTNQQTDEAIDILAQVNLFSEKGWLDQAFKVIERFPKPKFESLGIPTWLYGHEPPTPFATQIGKFFANSVREDGLLAIAKGGVIYTPGSAGTFQEIFQDITQNHYTSFDFPSPMIFMGTKYWTEEVPIYNLIKDFADKGILKNMLLSVFDQTDQIIQELNEFSSH